MTTGWLRLLLKHLPRPVSRYCIKGAIFRIYRLKKMHQRAYGNRALYHLMLEARRSYYRYGDVPLRDGYDKKSAVYLVRVTYTSNKTGEWLCARFVPGDGVPFGIDDFELYSYKGKSLEPLARRLILTGLFFISRLCGIPSTGLIHTPISFALMNKQVLADCRKFGFGCEYVVAQIPDALIDCFLTLRTGDKEFRPNFVPAYRQLKVNSQDIKLKRNSYIYRYPMYFLKADKVIASLKNLIKKGAITDKLVRHYSGGKLTAKDILIREKFKIEEFRWLGRLLIKNKRLRSCFSRVPDGPKLRIVSAKVWEKSLDNIIKSALKI